MVGCCECNGYFQVSEGMYIGYGYDHDTTRLTTILVPMKYFCVMKYLKIMVKSQPNFLKQLL
jgi:hypothetical protein